MKSEGGDTVPFLLLNRVPFKYSIDFCAKIEDLGQGQEKYSHEWNKRQNKEDLEKLIKELNKIKNEETTWGELKKFKRMERVQGNNQAEAFGMIMKQKRNIPRGKYSVNVVGNQFCYIRAKRKSIEQMRVFGFVDAEGILYVTHIDPDHSIISTE